MIKLTEEQKMLASTVRQFGQDELDPMAEQIDEDESWNADAFKKMGDLGLLGITVPEKFGGSGLGCVEATIVMEGLAEFCASTTLTYLAHTILCVNNINKNASEAQKEKYLPSLIDGTTIGAMAMTEPGAGSDALGLNSRAEQKNNHFVLNGSKTFITNGPTASVFVVYAKTGNRKKDISTFIVEKDFKGFSVGKKLKKFGMRGSPTSELAFDQCEVPKENLVGRVNDSVTHMMANLNIERVTISGISLGLAKACIDYCTQYVKERQQFNTPLAEFQTTQQKIADMVTQYEAAKAFTYQAAAEFDEGASDLVLGAKTKLFSAKMATDVCMEGIQLLGGYGYTKEYPVERFMRDAKLMEIGAGTNEIMRLIIARKQLGL